MTFNGSEFHGLLIQNDRYGAYNEKPFLLFFNFKFDSHFGE